MLPIMKSQKRFTQIPLLIAIIISFAVISVGAYGGFEYYKISKLVRESQQLVKEEKYNEANEKLEFTKNRWLVKTLGIQKEKIFNEIENNKKLLGDKSEYAQGVEEFNKENWEKAKELLSKVSEPSPYYQDAKNKIEEAQNNIVKKQIAEAIGKATEETQRQAAELEKKVKELQQNSADQPTISTSLPSSEINKIIGSIVSVICKIAHPLGDFNKGSGSAWRFPDFPGYFIFTNAHVVSTIDGSDIDCVVIFPKFPSGAPYYIYSTEPYEMGYTEEVDWALLKLTTPYRPEDTLTQIPLLSDYFACRFSDVNIGDKVTIFGYPAVGGNNITVTEGNISGFSGDDYKVSSGIIDKGNSGGAAILNKQKCSLGIPTWVSIGEASSVGIIQSWKTIYGDLFK